MTRPWHDLARWLRRARPPLRDVLSALLAGTCATAATLVLFIGAPYLLVEAATQPGWAAVAALLIVVEILAFMRSPLRFVERMSSHELGLASVVTWRRWLTTTIGTWPWSRISTTATGDLLERALADTDILQDLWLRSIIPFVSIALALLGGDLVVASLHTTTLDAHAAALALLVSQCVCVAALTTQFSSLVAHERQLRIARSRRATARLELQHVAQEFELLHLGTEVRRRLERQNAAVANTERRSRRSRRWVNLMACVGPVITLFVVEGYANHSIVMVGRPAVIVALVAIATVDLLATTRSSLLVAVGVTAASERLDALHYETRTGTENFPDSTLLDVESLTWTVGEQTLLQRVTLTIPAGRRVALTGPSGSGKTTLLRLLARLDDLPRDVITIGGHDVMSISESAWRAHVSFVGALPRLLDGVVDDVMRMGRLAADDPVGPLQRVGLSVAATDRFEHLSQGEAQRASVVRGLLNEPSVLLLDEPTNGLGPDERGPLLEEIFRRHGTIVVATHDPDVIALCDDVYELVGGRLSLLSR